MKTALNLLPHVYRRQRLIRRRVIQWTLVLGVALSSIAVARWYKVHEYRVLDRQLAAVSRAGRPGQTMLREITKMREQIAQVQLHQTIATELEDQRQVLALLGAVSNAARQTHGKLRLLDCHVVGLQADEVVSTHGGDAAQTGTVTLVGVSLDSTAVAEFEGSLLQSGLFADVKLIKSNERDQVGTKLYDYEVRCEL